MVLGNGDLQSVDITSHRSESDVKERLGALTITDLSEHLLLTFAVPTFRVLVVDSNRVAIELSCSDELLNGFLNRSR